MQTIYLGLAVLMAFALVGFGLGGAFGGSSVFESLSKEEGKGGSGFSSKIAAVQKKIKRQPSNAALWAELTKLQLNAGAGSEYYDSTTGVYTTKGKEHLRKVSSAWGRYLALESKKPSVQLAKDMLSVYGTEALSEPGKEVEVLQLIVAAPGEKATESHYYLLSYYAFLAHNEALGKLAMKKTLTFVPKAKRPQVEVELERVQKAAAAGATGAAGAAGTTGATTVTSTASTTSAATSSTSGGASKKSSGATKTSGGRTASGAKSKAG
ncbi:MAG: hypothetical protein ACYCUM_06760 [Solirubrobacteraceae bacterium]